jgi:hypothetical protein
LTKRQPAILPRPESDLASEGLILKRSEAASLSLLTDLRSDKGMQWVDDSKMWLSYLKLDLDAKDLTYDLATDVHGGMPASIDAGFQYRAPRPGGGPVWSWGAFSALGLGTIVLTNFLFGDRS